MHLMRPAVDRLLLPSHLTLATCAGLFLSGCAAPSASKTTAIGAQVPVLPARFLEAASVDSRTSLGSKAWWKTFDDRELDRFIEWALRDNLTLREAASRVDAARAVLRQSNARLFPSLDASGEVSERWESEDADSDPEAVLGTLLAWEPDVFGRLRAARRASARQVAASRADLAGARLLLGTAVGEGYWGRRVELLQLELLAQQIKVGETLLDLTRLRFGQGQASIVDVLQQEQQLKETRALEPLVRARAAQFGYLLDALLGRAPGGAPRPGPEPLPRLPPLPSAGLPSHLLLRRPDLVAAQERLAGLDARVTEAVAEKLPSFQLTASSAVAAANSTSLVATLLASAVAPLFDGGLRQAEVDRRRAELEQAVAAFGNLFLNALREVETALVNEREQQDRLQRQLTQLETAKRLLREARNRYSQGLTEYLPVLDALTTVQQLERDILTTRHDLISQRIILHRALGGPMG